MNRERAIQELSEITGTGFFGERHGGLLKREDAERFVDAVITHAELDAAERASDDRATLETRVVNLFAALSRIAGGEPATTLDEQLLRTHLHLAQRAAEVAVEDDLREAAKSR